MIRIPQLTSLQVLNLMNERRLAVALDNYQSESKSCLTDHF